jgi:hypothetical protein
MSEALAEFLDDISLHIEREIAKAPPGVARALLRDDSPLSTAEMLRILARRDAADDHRDAGNRSASATSPIEMSAV